MGGIGLSRLRSPLAIVALLGVLCGASSSGCGGDDVAVDGGVDDAGSGPDAGDAVDGGPGMLGPLPAMVGEISAPPLDCTGSYALPDEFLGEHGLAGFDWTLDDIHLRLAWGMPNAFENHWLSDNTDAEASLRVRSHLVPEAGYCYRDGLAAATAGAATDGPYLAALIAHVSAFSHRDTSYHALHRDLYGPPTYDVATENLLVRAIAGLVALENALNGAPVVAAMQPAELLSLRDRVAGYPAEMQVALAQAVFAIGETYLLKQAALTAADPVVLERIHAAVLADNYTTISNSFVSPAAGTVVADILAGADGWDQASIHLAAQTLANAADECRRVLEGITPFESPGIDVATPHGRIVVRTAASDDDNPADSLDDVALLIDLAGNDRYAGRYAATDHFWQSASVVIDVGGDDEYGTEQPDLADNATTVSTGFDNAKGFTQGVGLFGVGLLLDAAGNDAYRASVHAQGAGIFGVGVLADHDGSDSYQLGYFGQGTGFFGVGVLVDGGGDDRYAVYTMGEGVGKPGGHGVLLDLAGDDDYLCFYNDDPPELPSPGYQNYYRLSPSWAYNDGTEAHFMSVCQGVGWGYRGDWFMPQQNWMGGFGALVDFGDGNDSHHADTMSMGQGFVYGFGFLYDDGGDDRYRTFWWGPGAAAHMGIGLFVDEAGNDDMYVTRASGNFGFDTGIGWTIDNGGDDRYGGQVHYGESYNYGLSFFVNRGGDDVYNAGAVRSDVIFGGVRVGFPNTKLVGVFLDTGVGNDTYEAPAEGVGNDAAWHLAPRGDNIEPAIHIGIGVDGTPPGVP